MSLLRIIGYVGIVLLLLLAAFVIVSAFENHDWYGVLAMTGFVGALAIMWCGLRFSGRCEKDPALKAALGWNGESIGTLFRGPILHTPQGIVVLFFFMAYLLCAFLVGVLGVAPPFGWPIGKTVALCIAWPIILFLYFVRDNQPSFEASLSAASWQFFYGVIPVLVMLWPI